MGKAEILNKILKHISDKGANDLHGIGEGLQDPIIEKAVRGLERNGYLKTITPADSDNILMVIITQQGLDFVRNGSTFE